MSLADRALEGTVWFLPHLCCISGVHWGSDLALRVSREQASSQYLLSYMLIVQKYIAASSLVEGPFCEEEARPTTYVGAIFNTKHLHKQWASLPWLYISSRTFITRRLHSQLAVDIVAVVHNWIMFAFLACLVRSARYSDLISRACDVSPPQALHFDSFGLTINRTATSCSSKPARGHGGITLAHASFVV